MTSGSAEAIDLSHDIEDGMITYKGLPAPLIRDYLSREASRERYAPGTEFHIGKIEMVANTGTYVDSPFHRYAGGKDLSELPLRSLADLECLVAQAPGATGAIDRLPFAADEVRGRAVLVRTDWSRHWRTDRYFSGSHPHMTGALAQWLAEAGAALVGIDSYNIDSTQTGERPVHSILLGRDIPVVEHLCGLDLLPPAGSRFFAVPAKVKRLGTFPVRAFALVPR